jgi:hypothetical protein
MTTDPKPRRQRRLLLILLTILLLFAAGFGYLRWQERNWLTAAQVEQMIANELRPDSSRNEVAEWLRSRNFSLGHMLDRNKGEVFIDADILQVHYIPFGEDAFVFRSKSVYVEFHFDSKDKLVRHTVSADDDWGVRRTKARWLTSE